MKVRLKMMTMTAVLGILALAPGATASIINLTSSEDLILSGRDVLAAVNFYDSGRPQHGHVTVGTIQGVDFDDFRTNLDDDGNPWTLTNGKGTLATVIPQAQGREYNHESPFLAGTLAGADATEAEKLANSGGYYQNRESGTLNFVFNAGYELEPVKVQMIIGGSWDQWGEMTVSVDGNVMGTVFEDTSTGPQLLTFDTMTDASGGLAIALAETGGRYIIVSGVTVTAIPEPGTIALLGLAGLAMLIRRRFVK